MRYPILIKDDTERPGMSCETEEQTIEPAVGQSARGSDKQTDRETGWRAGSTTITNKCCVLWFVKRPTKRRVATNVSGCGGGDNGDGV